MDKREARQFTSSNPPMNYYMDRRGSFLDRLFARRRTSSTSSDDMNMVASMQRRGSFEPEVPLTQKVQEMKKPVVSPAPRSVPPEFSIFT